MEKSKTTGFEISGEKYDVDIYLFLDKIANNVGAQITKDDSDEVTQLMKSMIDNKLVTGVFLPVNGLSHSLNIVGDAPYVDIYNFLGLIYLDKYVPINEYHWRDACGNMKIMTDKELVIVTPLADNDVSQVTNMCEPKTFDTSEIESIISIIDQIRTLGCDNDILTGIENRLKTCIQPEQLIEIKLKKLLNTIGTYSEKFFDCKENGFSYELGCRYQKINLDSLNKVEAEIDYLTRLQRVYNNEFNAEIELINELIIELVKLEEYYKEECL